MCWVSYFYNNRWHRRLFWRKANALHYMGLHPANMPVQFYIPGD